jgi:hypothetical protein
VKAARAVAATAPVLAETLQRDWRKAARFYARFGVTEEAFRYGVSAGGTAGESVADAIWPPPNALVEDVSRLALRSEYLSKVLKSRSDPTHVGVETSVRVRRLVGETIQEG